MSDNAFCIHAHFYQPPREDPLSGKIPFEEGALPHTNWNEKILAECYQPNAKLGNFERISFNVGPTLLEWMSEFHRSTAEEIINQARKVYLKTANPIGMAQSYNHTILPLASERDKQTQIKWGLFEFENRFGHKPKGIWLPESAVDIDTLRIAEECGVEYVILAPWQCSSENINKNQPGWVELGGNRKIATFFYNQGLSTRVSFDPGATSNADDFVTRYIIPEFNNGLITKGNDNLIIIASDGELYGHHQKFRDQFLARLTSGSIKRKSVRLSSPAEWLQKHPPLQVVSILQNSSWSCHHGVLRWSDNCGCTPHSDWKKPLRHALDLVAELVDPIFERIVDACGVDPYYLRDEYIRVILGLIPMDEFLSQYLKKSATPQQRVYVEFLLRAQYERQRMYTSCGWFFDDFDRIEPRNNVKYAAQAVWLTSQVQPDIENAPIIAAFKKVISPRSALRADQVFKQHIRKAHSAWSEVSSSD